MTIRPNNQEVNLTFFKESGKYYTSGKAIVNHFLFENEYKQDIVNTQNAMSNGWQEHGYYVVVSVDESVDGFHEALFKPDVFNGIKREA